MSELQQAELDAVRARAGMYRAARWVLNLWGWVMVLVLGGALVAGGLALIVTTVWRTM